MPIKVVVSWAAGAWKSSVIQNIVKKLWYEIHDVWQIFRSRAIAKWLTIDEYDKIVEKHPEEDVEMDNDFKDFLEKSKNNCIVSWRMWFHFLPTALSIWLDVNPKEWARRVFLQNRWKQEKKYKDVDEVMKANSDRMTRLQKRMISLYGVDFMNKNNYKVIIKTDGKNIEKTSNEIINIIEEYKKNQGK